MKRKIAMTCFFIGIGALLGALFTNQVIFAFIMLGGVFSGTGIILIDRVSRNKAEREKSANQKKASETESTNSLTAVLNKIDQQNKKQEAENARWAKIVGIGAILLIVLIVIGFKGCLDKVKEAGRVTEDDYTYEEWIWDGKWMEE